LETQLVSFQELPSRLPSGIFVSSADVAVQFGALPRLGPAAIARAEQGILALAHASSVEVGTGHGVFVCDREQLDACVRGSVAGADAGDAAVACRRCLQKPSVAAMRGAGAVLPGPRLSGYAEGSAGEWVLTDSAFHVGAEACLALVAVAAAHPRAFAGVEVCAYGDLMQPMGEDADAGYLGRTDHVASMRSGADTSSADVSQKVREAETKLRRARELLARTMRGRPLLALPLVPSRFVHVGTMPELLQHCARDDDVLAAFPAPSAGIALGTWDVEKMDPPGTSRMPSVGADGVWGAAPGVGVGSCLLASRVGRGARVGAGSLVAHCDLGRLTVVGEGCLLHDVDLPHGARVPPGTFLHCVPLGAAAAAAAGLGSPRKSRDRDPLSGPRERPERRRRLLDLRRALRGGRGEEAREEHAVRRAGGGGGGAAGAGPGGGRRRLGGGRGEDHHAGARVPRRRHRRGGRRPRRWISSPGCGEGRRGRRRRAWRKEKEKPGAARLSVSISEALRTLAAHGPAVRRREALRGRVIGHAVGMLLAKDTPVEQWRARAPPLRAYRAREARAVCARAELCAPAGDKSAGLAVGRVALALASSDEETREAEAIARRALRDAVVAPFVRASAPLFGRRSVGESASETHAAERAVLGSRRVPGAAQPGGRVDGHAPVLPGARGLGVARRRAHRGKRRGIELRRERLHRARAAPPPRRGDGFGDDGFGGAGRRATGHGRGARRGGAVGDRRVDARAPAARRPHARVRAAASRRVPRGVPRGCAARGWPTGRRQTAPGPRRRAGGVHGDKRRGPRGARARGPAPRLGARRELRAGARAAARAARGRDAPPVGPGGARAGREVGGEVRSARRGRRRRRRRSGDGGARGDGDALGARRVQRRACGGADDDHRGGDGRTRSAARWRARG
jgi:hypothetical protein